MKSFLIETIFAASTITSNNIGEALASTVKFPIWESYRYSDESDEKFQIYLLPQHPSLSRKQFEHQALWHTPKH